MNNHIHNDRIRDMILDKCLEELPGGFNVYRDDDTRTQLYKLLIDSLNNQLSGFQLRSDLNTLSQNKLLHETR